MSEELSELGQAAVWYCEHGFGIIPLRPRGKVPITKHGLNDWTDDPDSARKLWAAHPTYNIGIVCGTPSGGLLVLDFDTDDDGEKDGFRTLNDWEKLHGELPETVTSITGGGGMHYLYRTDRTNIKPSVNHDLGVDVRSDGSYIVAPPSIHDSGRRYEWQDAPEYVQIATADGSVYDFLDHIQRNGGQSDDAPKPDKFELPETIGKGERDNTLYKYGCSLRSRGYQDDAIMAMLDSANRDRCKPPMPKSDIQRIARSVCTKGPGHDGLGEFNDASGVHAPHGGGGGQEASFFKKNGGIDHHLMGEYIINHDHARYIDNVLAVWTGNRWDFDSGLISRMVRKYAPKVKKADLAEVIAYVNDMAEHYMSNSFDGNRYCQFKNATINVVTQEIVEPSPEMLITNTLPIDLDLDVMPNEADAFLDAISANDAETRRVLEEIIGATITCGHTVSQCPMLIGRSGGGTASNGKSTFINTLRNIVGAHNVSSLDIAGLGHRFRALGILGKLANLGDDIPDGFLKSDELAYFKKIVTGEPITGEIKGGRSFDFVPMALCIFSMNTIPRLDDNSDGVFRRLAFVPFRRYFDPADADFDPDIGRKLTRPDILQRFAVLGLQRMPELVARGVFSPIQDMAAEVAEVKQNNDIVIRWLYEADINDADIHGRFVSDVYADFRRWCENTGERYPVTQTMFSRRVCSAHIRTLSSYKTSLKWDVTAKKNRRKFLYKDEETKDE